MDQLIVQALRCPGGCVWTPRPGDGRVCVDHDWRLAEPIELVLREDLDASYEAGFRHGYEKRKAGESVAA